MAQISCIQKIYPNMNIRDAIELIGTHKLNIFNFIKAECKTKKEGVVDVIEYYSTN